MGLFNSYLKEGPGVDVNAPKKKGIFLFFEVLGRKFFKLMKANGLYFLTSIPFFVIVMLILAPILRGIFVSAETVGDNPMSQILFDLMFAGIIFNLSAQDLRQQRMRLLHVHLQEASLSGLPATDLTNSKKILNIQCCWLLSISLFCF